MEFGIARLAIYPLKKNTISQSAIYAPIGPGAIVIVL
jgi:hypothetical protein